MGTRRRAASVVLGLWMALATVLGVGCLCAHGQTYAQAVQYVAAVSPMPDAPGDDTREHACAAPGHDQCGGGTVVDTPATGPAPHPLPQALPTRVDTRPVAAPTPVTAGPAAPRPPNLHVLQVLRT
ncbi:hypothetical protein ACFV7R_16200 [Streptomyces sp. NPDC059866]|uniref:hypothetical protein n=1 Tax=Streptomyces sp. NPDC059866 TaxID=3346978 RepID=UPI003661BA9B